MRIPRFYTPEIRNQKIVISGEELHHLKNVLRLKEGCKVILFDGKGKNTIAKIKTIHRKSAEVEILHIIDKDVKKTCVACACAIPKGKRLNFMFQKLCELGLDVFIPVRFERSVARFSANKKEKLQRIAIQTAKQCKRDFLCTVYEEITPKELVDMFGSYKKSILLDPYANTKILDAAGKKIETVIYIVGPEGGLSQREREFIISKGAVAVGIGWLILRIETAAIAVMSLFAALLERP